MTDNKNNGAPPAAETTGALPLRKLIPLGRKANIPPTGINTGRFLDVDVPTKDTVVNGKPQRMMRLDVELQALNADGKPFVVSKRYNLAARGVAILSDDLRDWAGQDIVPDGEELDASVFLHLPVRVEITNSKQGKKYTTSITSFLPPQADLPA